MTPAKSNHLAYSYGALICTALASLVVTLSLLALVVALLPIWVLTLPMRLWGWLRA
jgi:hypothetical protein